MKLTIGVMGGASGAFPDEVLAKLARLGRAIADRGAILITGACPGLPQAAVRGAAAAGGLVVGISPGLSRDEHVGKYASPTEGFDVLIYTGSGLMGREVENIHSSDIVVIAGGSSGTLGEFAIAYDEGRLIGVLTGTGGIADGIDRILPVLTKPTGAVVLHDDDPERLLDRLIAYYRAEHHKHPNCFCAEGPPAGAAPALAAAATEG
jgi:uncharacterized protein (TIGR00725 family)